MTERATGRHRASHKSSTPLATLTGSLSLVGDYVGSARRTGVIIAMSSGLVASMAIPAHAVTAAPPEASGPQTASIPAVPSTGGNSFFAAPQGGLLSLPTDLVTDDETVAAPAAAAVDFGGATFTVVPVKPAAAPKQDGGDTQQAPTSRRGIRLANTVTTDTSTQSQDSSSSNDSSASDSASTSGSAVLGIAFRYKGVPYRWGGTTPNGFDCSGFTQYVFKQLGINLPRTSQAQYSAVKIIPRSQARPGDLVFMPGLGHVGIVVGDGMMIDAPHSGTVVQVRKIYSSGAMYGRP